MVDNSARNRVTYLGYGILSLIIGILLWWIIFNVEIQTTLMFFLMLFFAVFSVAILIFYEIRNMRTDLVDHATLFADAPPLALSRSFEHPVTGEVLRFAGEIVPVEVKSSKISYQKIRGYSVSQLAENINYAEEIKSFREFVYEVELGKYHYSQSNDELSEEEVINIEKEIEETGAIIQREQNRIIQKHTRIASSTDLEKELTEAKQIHSSDVFRRKVEDELKHRRAEEDNVYAELAQLEHERDKYEKELRRWMQSANADLNKSDALIAARFAKLIKEGSLVETYENPDIPNQQRSISAMNSNLAGTGIAFGVLVVVLVLGYSLFSSISSALDNLGEWASFIYLLVMWIGGLLFAVFIFNYSKSRISDVMNNTSSSNKMVMQK